MGLPTDANVIPLPDAVTKKRARGRPRKENALSNAERQKAFRARQAAACKSVTVTKILTAIRRKSNGCWVLSVKQKMKRNAEKTKSLYGAPALLSWKN
ncbi:hypothetical protein WM40_26230 [Robbsia andropogonis]|uniref:Uncharacterized protein n=1 Tax=Robbsia andropogonis TaxID=28092 RepID=A0A0F5JTE2_9BURK|nr:hypothetical protein WM40_26230 [Robbsia andropogonis]